MFETRQDLEKRINRLKFIKELKMNFNSHPFISKLKEKIKAEKGADYFRNYPTKDELMGEKHADTMATMQNTPNMGKGAESSKHVHTIDQMRGSRSS